MNRFRAQGFRIGILVNGAARAVHSVLGFLLFVFIAKRFGADFSTDSFLVTNALLGIVLLAGESIVGICFIPIYIEIRDQKSEDEAREFTNALVSFLVVFLAGFSVLVCVVAPAIAYGLAPGFSPEARLTTVNLIRISSPLILLLGGTGISASIFYAHQNFSIPAFTSPLLVLGQVSFLLLFGRTLGIYSIQIGAIAGVTLQLILLVFFLEKRKAGVRFRWNPRHFGVPRVLKLLMPRLVAMATTRFNVIVDRFFASGLEVGFVSALGYAQRVIQVPSMLVMEAVAKTLVPALSKHDSAGETDQIREKLSRVFLGLNAILIPLMIMVFILREPIVRILFERGAFGPSQTRLTARALFCYNVGLITYSYNLILNAAYYSLQDSATPMKLGILAVGLNFFLDMFLVKIMGMEGIALATSFVGFVRLILLALLLDKRLGKFDYRAMMTSFLKCSVASIPMGIVIWLMLRNVGELMGAMTLANSVLRVSAACAAGACIYFSMCYMMKVDETHKLVQYVGKKFLIS